MRFIFVALASCSLLLTGCKILLPVADVATRQFDKVGTFEEIQSKYTSNLRFGLYEDALPMVEPKHRARFQSEIPRFRELRLSEARTESIQIDSRKINAEAVVVLRGYWLSAPFEKEKRVVQRWRRDAPSQDWYVTPNFEALLTPSRLSQRAF